MKIPNKIKVGTQTFEVVEKKRKHDVDIRDNGTYGYCIDKDNTIIIDIEMPLSMKRVTLFHEIFHAIRFVYGGSHKPNGKTTSYEEWEHYWIGLYEEPYIQVFRDNPDLVTFLTSKEE